jgi:hypothetical protein
MVNMYILFQLIGKRLSTETKKNYKKINVLLLVFSSLSPYIGPRAEHH